MNGMTRNTRKFYYSIPGSGTDEAGNTVNNVYANPVAAYANISAAKGDAERLMFGTLNAFDRVINPAPPAMPKRTDLRLWVDTMPTLTSLGALSSTSAPYDYIVILPADGLNNNAFAIKKVSVG
jgi:hypothetical protein